MKKILLLLAVTAASSFGQVFNGVPGQFVNSLPNAALSNSTITFTGTCGISSPGAIALGATATISDGTLVNPVAAYPYTVLTTDCGKIINLTSGSSGVFNLPAAGGSFPNGFALFVQNNGAGTATLTPASGNINTTATLTLSAGQGAYLVSDGATNWEAMVGRSSGGAGTVTNATFVGGLISIATATTTPAFTVAGTSGGIPYFSSATTWASSGALTQYGVVLGGGAAASPTVTGADTTTTHALFATATSPAFRALLSSDLPAVLPGTVAPTSCIGATTTPVATAGTIQACTLSINTTIAGPTGLVAGQSLLFDFTQATGPFTVAWNAVYHGAFVVGTTTAKHNVQSFYSPDGTNLYATSWGNINQ